MSKNSEENTETNAWKFVDLLFTGKYVTKEQNNNLVKLTKELKNNDIASVYIDNDIKDLITSAENKDNEDLKKRLETCYKSLNNKIIIQDDIPLYFRKLKDIDINFYYKIVFIFKIIYENKIMKQRLDRINKK